jgi:xanthine dehydrogenase accessory factor
VSAEALDRVRCPVGLSLGAQTPAEIAVSIVAELVQKRRGASA